MATTSLSLGDYWERFIKAQLANGRYSSASELIRESLRLLEARNAKLEALRAAIQEGLASGPAEPLDMADLRREAREAFAARKAAQ